MTFLRELWLSNLWRQQDFGLAAPRPEEVDSTKAAAK